MSEDKIKVGVIGTGFGTAIHLPVFKDNPDVEVLAVCSEHRERAEAAASRFDVPNAFTDYRKMFEIEELDLVSVTAPPFLHHPMTMAALDAGKHVLCEKPMAFDLSQAREMYHHAGETGLFHMINFEHRFRPTRMYMTELIEEGYLGQLNQVNVNHFSWASPGFRVDRTWNWFSQKEKGGGVLQALGSHYIDALRLWFGEITEVCAQLDTLIKERRLPDSEEMRPVDTEDTFNFMVRFQSGALGTVCANSMSWRGRGEYIEAYGSEGTLVIGTDMKLRGAKVGQGELEVLPIPDKDAELEPKDPGRLAFSRLVEELVRKLCGDRKISPDFYDGMKCQQVLDAIRLSSKEKRWVELGQVD